MNVGYTVRVVVLAGLLATGLALFLSELSQPTAGDYLRVHFFDVGQGDAIFIETPERVQVLVDGGAGSAVLRELSAVLPWYDHSIDVIVATHPDTDHVGGLVDVLARYQVDTILETTAENDAPAAAAFSAAAAAENAAVYLPQAGDVIYLGPSTTLQVFSPTGDTTDWPSNAASIIFKVQYGDIGFMLSGDAPSSIEDYVVGTYGADLEAEVLKLGHHGSRTSTSELWLDTVTPEYAIVSAAVDSRYGHPHQEVMQRVFARNITTFHTGTDGTITFATDGKTVWRE